MGLLARLAKSDPDRFRAIVGDEQGQTVPTVVRLANEGTRIGQPLPEVRKGFPVRVTGGSKA